MAVEIKLIGMPVVQNQQDFIVGVFKIGTILKFTKYTKRLIIGYKEDGKPDYNEEIQRELEKSRVEKIADFLIDDPEATFPTNLVLHIPIQAIKEQKALDENNLIHITLDEKVVEGVEMEKISPDKGDVYITIIDGQHRLRGIERAIERLQSDIMTLVKTLAGNADSEALQKKLAFARQRLADLLKIDLVVSFFIEKTLEYQAMIFATINRTQKRVSESLVYSLFGLTTEDSPQKTALQVSLALNAHQASPFHNRIKLYGGTYQNKLSPPLSQATMVKSIIDLISETLRESERDRFRSRRELLKRTPSSKKDLPLRLYYARNEDTKISDLFFFFFSAVRDTFVVDGKSLWTFNPETMTPTNILQTTVGYQALLDIMIDIISELGEQQRFVESSYTTYLQKAKHLTSGFKSEARYPFTSKSRALLYLDLNLAIWPPTSADDPRILKLKEAEMKLDQGS